MGAAQKNKPYKSIKKSNPGGLLFLFIVFKFDVSANSAK
jgi:hypothetical protein